MGIIDVQETKSSFDKRREEVDNYFKKESAKVASKEIAIKERANKEMILDKMKAEVELLQDELGLVSEPEWNRPLTWMQCAAGELSRGDAIRIEENGILHTYIYARKLQWWRDQSANILIHHKDNPDKRKRIGEIDFVFAFKGYMQMQQLSKLGVTF